MEPQESQEKVIDLVQSDVRDEVQLKVKFQGYLKRQEEQVARFKKMEAMALPEDIDYKTLSGLSNEVVEKLGQVRPAHLVKRPEYRESPRCHLGPSGSHEKTSGPEK